MLCNVNYVSYYCYDIIGLGGGVGGLCICAYCTDR